MRGLSRIGMVCLLICIALLFCSVLVRGQAGSSTVRGEVTDPQGKVIAGAAVTLKNQATGFSRSQVTGEAGSFSFELIPPGKYTLEADASGFRKKILSNVEALVGTPTDVSLQMEVGRPEETITVEATSSMVTVNTQDASLGNNFVSNQIADLPLEARNVVSLLTLQPGVTRDGYVAGARSDQSNITLDGVDINEAQTNALDSSVLRLNQEAIEEFRVETVNSNANQGRSSAAQVNLVTKSGTNAFHGALFEFYRGTLFEANDFFSNRSGVPRTPLVRNTFSGAIGGPIVKDKLFFFYSYEGRRDATATSVVRTVPLPSLGQGLLRYVDPSGAANTLTTGQLNAIYPAVGVNPAAVSVLADAASKYPANDFTVGDSLPGRLLNTAGFRFNASTPVNLNSNVAKFDWNIDSKQTAFARINAIYDLTGQAPEFPDTPAPNVWSHPWGIAVGHTWTPNGRWVNNFRYGLTRQGFTQLGDHSSNLVHFRFVFEPRLLPAVSTLARTTPVHNFVDDVSWVKGSHTIQFGANIRLIRNSRVSYANAYDDLTTNPSGYQQGGNVLSDPVSAYLDANNLPAMVSVSETQNAAAALIGRFSNYTANFTFGHSGDLLSSGTPSARTFATEEYEGYIQDAWKLSRDVTLTYGLRYGASRPVYETSGFEVKPTVPLSVYFATRVQSASEGIPFNDPLSMDLSGPANGRSPMYSWDLSGFQPRAAIAWSPSFERGWLRSIFGGPGKSALRAGFAMLNDYYGEALATFFDLNNTLGFSSSDAIPVNVYNVSSNPAPLFTGFNQDVRSLPRITVPGQLKFPLSQPVDMGERIEASLDSALQLPREYTFSVTFERELPAGLFLQASYEGRLGRRLLAQRDAMALNDLVDPKSHMDWYTAATMLEKIRQTRPPANTSVAPIPYFENIFPANLRDVMADYEGVNIPSGFTPTQTIFWIARNLYGNDWTDLQGDLDNARFINGQNTLFFNPQYGALTAWSTIANSNYHSLAASLRQRFNNGLQWDFNYTLSHSLDDASGLQNGAGYASSAFILNPIRQRDFYANSGFDLRHQININGIYDLPIGHGRTLGGSMNEGWDALLGGWKISGIYRWNTGLPVSAPFDDARWATNWQVQSNAVTTRDVAPCITSDPPKLFGCNTTAAYQSFRNPYPGESGMRNIFRLPGYTALDLGLNKAINIGKSESRRLEIRWEVFNVTNTQHFGARDTSRSGFGIRLDPAVRNLAPPTNWSNFTGIQGAPRVMQVGARFVF